MTIRSLLFVPAGLTFVLGCSSQAPLDQAGAQPQTKRTGQTKAMVSYAEGDCSCTGTGPGQVPVTVECGASACGSDYFTYACTAAGWSWTGEPCGGTVDAGSGTCQCTGTGPGMEPVTVDCGQSACGSDYFTYACDASGWTWTGQACGTVCECTGTGPGMEPVTVACGQSACGSDYFTYACDASGWTWTGQSCGLGTGGAGGAGGTGGSTGTTPCECHGTGPGNAPVTASCGESACGSDYFTYACDAHGWTWTGQPCGSDAGTICECHGTGPGDVPVTVSCGESACGSDYFTYACDAHGWTWTGQSCSESLDAASDPPQDAGLDVGEEDIGDKDAATDATADQDSADASVPDCTGTLARGIAINEIAVFQSGKIAVMQNGAAITPTSLYGAQIVAGRKALFRIYVTVDSGFAPRDLTAQLTVNGGGTPYESTQLISASSTELTAEDSFLIEVPGDQITAGLNYSVRIIETGPCSGEEHQPVFPSAGAASLATRVTGIVQVTLVPVTSGGRTPTISQTLVDAVKVDVDAMYPTTDTQLTVSTTPLPGCNVEADGTGWDECLYLLMDRRDQDDPARSVYYMGILEPEETIYDYCPSGCVTGMSFVVTSPSAYFFRVALSISYMPWALSTVSHELGHAHGRDHSPGCGAGSPDQAYPASYIVNGIGTIGWTGWDMRSPGSFLDPSVTPDFMSYCDDEWISDYVYKALADRINAVSTMADRLAPAGLNTWWKLQVWDGTAKWGTPFAKPVPPAGIAEPAFILDAAGTPIAQVTVYRTDLSSAKPAAVYMVPEPQAGWAAIQVGGTTIAY